MPHDEQDEQARLYSRIVLLAWSDDAFRERLLAEPAAVLREHGIAVPEGTVVQVHEARAGLQHFVLPARPAELSEGQLAALAGGAPATTLAITNQSRWTLPIVIFQQP